jgi:plastocyanin
MPRVMRAQRFLLVVGAAVSAFALSACQIKDNGDDLANGKAQFVAKCGSCHVLERAGTTGVTGPSLDAAFDRALSEGFGRNTVKGIVHRQILYPNTTRQVDPATGKLAAAMPAKLVKGEAAEDVAAYVAFASAKSGKDAGRLADIGVKKAEGVAKLTNGELDIPVAETGLAYAFAAAEAAPGSVKFVSANPQNVPHNIAVEGNGLNEEGPVIQGGANSEITVELKAGEYTFYCSVPGHREGGMVGKLTVK